MDCDLSLVLGGGNALGSYQAGVYQALHERGRELGWIVGASAGAINGALLAGNAPADRLARLAEFWEPGADGSATWWPDAGETLRRTAAVTATMTLGRPGVFGPVGPLGSWWTPDPSAAAPSLFDLSPLAARLTRMVDLDRLNAGAPRFTATAVDLRTGEDVWFDTTERRVGPEHIRASAALLPTFAPVAIDGRNLVDGGLSANLPLDPVLAAPSARPGLCIAVDLMPLHERPPRTLGEAIGRAQDLMFAAQSRRTLERWQGAYAHDPRFAGASVTVARLAYADQEREVAGKAMDYSPESIRARWDAGHRDASALLDRLDAGEIATGAPGLTIV